MPMPTTMTMTAEEAVAQLFRVHMGLTAQEDEEEGYGGDGTEQLCIRSFRDLFRVQALQQSAQKLRLLAAAERTCCAGVLMSVLLFLSQTMARQAFQRALVSAPLAKQHWMEYELSRRDEDTALPLEAHVATTLTALQAMRATQEVMTTQFLALVFQYSSESSHNSSLNDDDDGDNNNDYAAWRPRQPLIATVSVAQEVLRVVTRTKPFKMAPYAISLLRECIALSEWQLVVEKADAFFAPSVQTLSKYLDKRARGANLVNANWRMRYFQLDGASLSYHKHGAERLAQSRNPFLDARRKGGVTLTSQTLVQPLDYTGKFSRRPYCIQIGTERDALILDAGTRVTQAQWLEALQANVRRLSLPTRWRRTPRSCVYYTSVAYMLRYALRYHYDAADDAPCSVWRLGERIDVDSRRVAFATLVAAAQREDWTLLEAAVAESLPSQRLSALTLRQSGAATDNSSTTAVDPTSSSGVAALLQLIGYGPLLDVVYENQAPRELVLRLEDLHTRYDGQAKTPWVSRRLAIEQQAMP